jgi:thioredoxin-like negative regulator of GroEL
MLSLTPLDQFDFHRRLETLQGPGLVMFGSPGCGGCRHLRRVLLAVQEICPDWHCFEVDVQRDPGLAQAFEVFHLPSLFLFHAGRFHCELKAEAGTRAIVRATRAALRLPAEEEP